MKNAETELVIADPYSPMATRTKPYWMPSWLTRDWLMRAIFAILGASAVGIWHMYRENLDQRALKVVIDSKEFQKLLADAGALRTDVGVIGSTVGGMDERIKFFERRFYELRAGNAGIKNPQIHTVDTKPNSSFRFEYPVAGSKVKIEMDYIIERFVGSTVTFRSQATVMYEDGKAKSLEPERFTMQVGEVMIVFNVSGLGKEHPRIAALRPLRIMLIEHRPEGLVIGTGESAAPTT